MKIYVSSIGSGNTLNFPHNKEYSGVLAIAHNSKENGLKYKGSDIEQDKIFEMKYLGTEYPVKKLITINTYETTFEIGSKINEALDNIKKEFKDAKFHFEISAGYKKIGHIMTLISYIREDIYKLTFANHDKTLEILPIIKIKFTRDQKSILKGYIDNCKFGWNGQIASNKFIMEYSGNRKFPYRIISQAKKMGLIDERNHPTDFGKLFTKFCC